MTILMTKSFNVLLIDDSQAINEMNRYFFKKCDENIEVETAINGNEALHYLNEVEAENFPDLILLDLKMPVLNGFELLTKIKENQPKFISKLNVVLLTTSMNPEDEMKMRDFECVKNYLIKPLSLRQVNYLVSIQLGFSNE
jgi:CheY-like chemotaxis protein